MNVFELIFFCLGAMFVISAIVVGAVCLSLAAFWKSWREDNDADWS